MEYYIDPTTKYPPQTVRKKPQIFQTGVRVLEQIFDSCGTRARALQTAVLIAFDLEYSHPARKIFQIGIATLDTQDLSSLSIDDSDETFRTVVGRRLFLLRQTPEPPHQYSRPYLFGSAELVSYTRKELEGLLHPVLTPLDERQRPRNVVLVGHAVAEDMETLRWYTGIELSEYFSIKAIVDTETMAGGVHDGVSYKHASVKRTCEYLGLSTMHLHNAGDDAFYILLALLLLLLFRHYKYEKQHLSGNWITLRKESPAQLESSASPDQQLLWECQLELIRRIGRAPHVTYVPEEPKKKFYKPQYGVQNNLGDITDGIASLFD